MGKNKSIESSNKLKCFYYSIIINIKKTCVFVSECEIFFFFSSFHFYLLFILFFSNFVFRHCHCLVFFSSFFFLSLFLLHLLSALITTGVLLFNFSKTKTDEEIITIIIIISNENYF